MNLSVLRMLLRPEPGNTATLVIPASAFAVVTTLVLTVVGGAQAFWRWDHDDALIYQALAAVALVLLVVPLASLGGAAARLSARRRDERLSTLRLLGMTPAGVATLTVLESTLVAAIGALAGVLGHLALAPAIALIPFRGEALGLDAVLLGAPAMLAVCAGAVLLAAVSAVLGLRRVVISPLGVRTRAQPASVHWLRAVAGAALLGLAVLLAQSVPAIAAAVSIAAVLAVLFGGTLALLNLIGPWVLTAIATRQARRAQTPERLLAARTVLDAPKAAWRQVGAIAMASFMAVFAGTGVSLMSTMSAEGASAQDLTLVPDMRTGLNITLVGSFLMVAASVGVTQAADVLDQRPLHHSLHQLGVPLRTVDAARRRAIMSPLVVTALGSALCAGVVVFPLLGIALIVAPVSLLTIALVLAAGIAVVGLSTLATRPMLARAFA
ncbi:MULTISPECIES: FtsX-like permease family protein [Microbacterium]|uniref:FtsX-like permease family protein n=1 Tax=Microbacterium TaxID=33882 RepID=UPI00217CE8C0|nr:MULTISPECIES: FtsX-like permease family protein [Microbacterium]UWF78450.1 permease [Microbacterium neungamense]WCM56626.1 permease [Microbacterium sp. EF45047]